MTRRATTDITLYFISTITNVLDDGSIVSVPLHHKIIAQTLANGVSANQANRVFHLKNQTIDSGNTIDLSLHDFTGIDIGGGAGKDALGQTIDLEEIVLFLIKQNSGDGRLEVQPTDPGSPLTWITHLTVSNGGALKAGSVHLMYEPDTDAFDIINGADEFLRLGANGGDVNYDLLIVGRHDDDESSSSSSSSQSSSSSSSQSSSSSSSTQSTSSTSTQSTEEAYSSSSST